MPMKFGTHERVSTKLLLSTLSVWALLAVVNLLAQTHLPPLLPLVITAQGLWLYRLYAVAHEASHDKLFPDSKAANDLAGSFAMAWVWAPLTIFRQIHHFHHGANRRAAGVATLDTYVVDGRIPRWWYYAQWYLLVFAGGFFFHTLASILAFLVLPVRWGKRLSPAFNSWNQQKRLISWAEFSLGLGLHALVMAVYGMTAWGWLLGAPILVFAWVWSAMLYIYHYDTTIGKKVGYNVRSLPNAPLFTWLLLNFNHHSVHHHNPNIPWYELPRHVNPQPDTIRNQNEQVATLVGAVTQQLKGPRLVPKELPFD